MLGPVKPRRVDQPVTSSLDALVPADHFYRHLERTLDLSFVREFAQDRYAAGGRPSIDPVVFFKLQLILFFDGLRSERQLIQIASLNLAHRWYLGYALDEPLPDHSSLTRIRTRLGVAVFQQFFERVVELCQQAGLVWGRELFFDATKVRANADLDSVVPRFFWQATQHVARLFDEDAAASGEPTTEPGPAEAGMDTFEAVGSPGTVPRALCAASSPETVATLAAQRASTWQLLEERRLDPERPSIAGYQRLSDRRVSSTDPDAALMAEGRTSALGYHDHYAVDGGRARIILAALVTPANVMENVPLQDLLWRARFRWHLHPKRAVGDSTYGTVANIRALEEQGIHAYVPLSAVDRRAGFFGHDAFRYDQERDVYLCPQGAELRFRGHHHTARARAYQAPAAACQACPIRTRCTNSRGGRILTRSLDEAYLERVRGYHQTAAYRKARRKRNVWVEPLFGEAKQWHGMRRFRLRGLDKANMEGLRVAAGQNLKRWLAATGWGRRLGPCGSLLAPSSQRSTRPRATPTTVGRR
jgi:transposase